MLINLLKQSWLVMAAALVFGLLVAGIYGQLDPIIKKNEREKLEREMRNLLGAETTFEEVKDTEGETVLYYMGKDEQGEVVGYAIKAEGSGFADKIGLLIAIDGRLENLLGIGVLKSNETPGFGDKIKESEFRDQFKGCPAVKLKVEKTGDRSVVDEQIIAITGATVSSEAVTKIINEAIRRMGELWGNEKID
ncbi:MAG: hypothetical protein AMJ79_12635 [Phycisphaerae bacterium SM23_30]|nr:MAG: hypothetical protein AMJ79_12635 [Phycisphaerae bacterium SM23_30]